MMSNIMANRQKVLAYVALALGLAQIGIMLTAWLLTAAWPEDFTRSFLSAEGVRWFLVSFRPIWLRLSWCGSWCVASHGVLIGRAISGSMIGESIDNDLRWE